MTSLIARANNDNTIVFNNLLTLNVFFEDLSTDIIKEVESYDVSFQLHGN